MAAEMTEAARLDLIDRLTAGENTPFVFDDAKIYVRYDRVSITALKNGQTRVSYGLDGKDLFYEDVFITEGCSVTIKDLHGRAQVEISN